MDSRREEEVLNLLEQLKRHVMPAGLGIYQKLDRGFAEFTTEILALKMASAPPEAAIKTGFPHLSTTEQAVVLLLEKAGPSGLTRTSLHRTIYWNRTDDDCPDIKIIDVLICKIRLKLVGSGFQIKTIHGRGYVLKPGEQQSRLHKVGISSGKCARCEQPRMPASGYCREHKNAYSRAWRNGQSWNRHVAA